MSSATSRSQLRSARVNDVGVIVMLNNSEVPKVNEQSLADVEQAVDRAPYFRIIAAPNSDHTSQELRGMLVGYGADSTYESPNYRWFLERLRNFIYVDRVIVGPLARGQGHGRRLYRDFAEYGLRIGATTMACEVNVRPRNEESLAFHKRLGFRSVGERGDGAGKVVVMLTADLSALLEEPTADPRSTGRRNR